MSIETFGKYVSHLRTSRDFSLAEIDNVSHTAVVKSIRLVKNIVKSTINAKKKEL